MALAGVKQRAAELGYAVGWGLVKGMPGALARRSFDAAADVASVRNGRGTQQLRRNLRRVVGPERTERELDELVGAALRSYSRYWMETFRLQKMDKRAVAQIIDSHMVGQDNLAAGLDRGKGVVLALPHQGNWDAAGIWLVANHGRFATVAERLKPESLYDRFVAYRESLGFEILPLTGGERAPTEVLKERLRENKVVCLLGDRDLSRRGIEVDFFGERARLPGGPALLAAVTGAALCTVSTWFEPDGWGQSISAPLEIPQGRLSEVVPHVTQQVAHGLEPGIAARPQDWHMLQQLWLADLTPRTER